MFINYISIICHFHSCYCNYWNYLFIIILILLLIFILIIAIIINIKRHLSFKPGSHFRTSPCTCPHLLSEITTVLESFNEDLLAAFDFDFDICPAETPGPKSWGYGILSIYSRWSIHAWREGYHQDLAWWWMYHRPADSQTAWHENTRGLGDIRLRPNCGSIQMQENQEELSSSMQTGIQVRMHTISWKGFLVFQHPLPDSTTADSRIQYSSYEGGILHIDDSDNRLLEYILLERLQRAPAGWMGDLAHSDFVWCCYPARNWLTIQQSMGF